MRYIELKIHASRQGVEAVTELLMRNGITGISVEDPADLEDILNKKNEYPWDYIDEEVRDRPEFEPVVRAWIEDSEEGRQLLQSLKLQIMNLKSLEMEGRFGWDVDFGRLYAEADTVDDGDWKNEWKKHFRPIKITDRLVVKPTWEDYSPAPGEQVIEIDPGMAFGTGSHETTRLCIQLMEKYGKPGAIMLDVGCGSGILAIGGGLLGFGRVLGIEIDPDAVKAAEENTVRNGLENTVEIRQGDLADGVDETFDLVVANLMADLVIRLAEDCIHRVKDGGVFISSGILLEKKDQVRAAVEAAGFTILEIAEEGEWCAIAAQKPESDREEEVS